MRINRDKYLNELISKMHNKMIKIITGIRRCGKSYLLNEIFYDYLISLGVNEDHIIRISLEDLENEYLTDAYVLNNHVKSLIKDDQMYYLIVDEIQQVNRFVPLLNGWLKIKNLDVYVSGSNSRFLSKDVITEFRGRGDEIYVSPLTFKEYYDARGKDFDDAWNEYIIYGGMPFVLERSTNEQKSKYLKDLFNEIYIKDIKERYGIRNDSQLETLLNIISSSIGSLTNPSKIEHTFKSVKQETLSRNTIESYLDILEDTFLIKKTNRYDIKGRKYINTPSKYYFVDMGLRNARLNFRQLEDTHMMENIIFSELIHRGYNVDIGVVEVSEKNENGNYVRKSLEIDFVANISNDKIYVQSAYHLPSPEKVKQEIRPFLNVDDSFRKFIIVRDNIDVRKDDYGITTIGLKHFLLNDDPFRL
ncbi:ATP-binding protein [Acholeplasma vituli]|uniref:ATP-binding protein n=2 Tax=Paracholeplasma vituli TaxID=69473 RepID=A0ABT2PW71_9MOLU|nr:ATP-binding protein [Paracholeplasma vituli]